jgi:hypothetical protein
MASLFFDFKCHGGSSAATTAVSWCKTEHLLAVATEDGELNFFQDEVPGAMLAFKLNERVRSNCMMSM